MSEPSQKCDNNNQKLLKYPILAVLALGEIQNFQLSSKKSFIKSTTGLHSWECDFIDMIWAIFLPQDCIRSHKTGLAQVRQYPRQKIRSLTWTQSYKDLWHKLLSNLIGYQNFQPIKTLKRAYHKIYMIGPRTTAKIHGIVSYKKNLQHRSNAVFKWAIPNIFLVDFHSFENNIA